MSDRTAQLKAFERLLIIMDDLREKADHGIVTSFDYRGSLRTW